MIKLERGDAIVVYRDVLATVIPHGHNITVPGGTLVRIIQALGGAHTIEYNGQWLMVHIEDRDALGLEPFCLDIVLDGDLEDQVWSVLRTCYDPEVPVNIVDLGLIYEVGLTPHDAVYDVKVVMTLTAAGCGMGPIIVREVERKVTYLPWVKNVTVDVVFDPPWSQMRMSEEARLSLGLL